MFTKSGRKLVPISIPERKDAPANCNAKVDNHIDDQIQIILGDLVSADCANITFATEPNAIQDNSPSESNIPSKTLIQHNFSIPSIDAKEKFIANDVLFSKLNHISAHTYKSILSTPSKDASIQIEKAQQGTNVFDVSIPRIDAEKEHFKGNDVLFSQQNHLSTAHTDESVFFTHSKDDSIQMEKAQQGTNVFDVSIPRIDAEKEHFKGNYVLFSQQNHLSTAHTDESILSTPSKDDSLQMENAQQGTNIFDNSEPCIDAAKECFIPNYVLFSKPNHISTAHTDETKPNHISTAHESETTLPAYSEIALNQMKKVQQDFSAIKAEDIPIGSSTSLHTRPQHIQFSKSRTSAEPPKSKLPLNRVNDKDFDALFIKTINETEYVPYTLKSNVLQRERKIQVSASSNKKTLDSAVQSDLKEDEDSENSQSDWINDIIEEYELIENANMYECHICGEVCSSRASNLKHSMMHEESCSLLCFRCGRLFLNTSKLLAHEDKMHSEKQLEIKKALRCPKLNCLKAFHSKRQLFDHIDHHGNKMIEQRCSRCQRSFTSSLQLLCHTNRRSCLR